MQSFALGERLDEMSEPQAYQPLGLERLRVYLLEAALQMMNLARHDFRDPGQAKGKMSFHGQIYGYSLICCRTQLEAEAYAAHIAGLHLLEHPNRKPAALAKLQRAQ